MHILVHIGPKHGDRGVNMIMFSYKYCLSAPIISREYTKALHSHILQYRQCSKKWKLCTNFNPYPGHLSSLLCFSKAGHS